MSTAAIASQPAPAPLTETVWDVDPAHASAHFKVRHLMVAWVRGQLGPISGSLTLDEVDVERSHVAVSIDARGIDTRNGQRDEHLRSADFFDVDNHPEIRFESTEIVPLDETSYRIVGDLTIRGTTNQIELRAVTQGSEQDPWGNTRVGLEVTGELNREAFGLTWNQALESGGLLVGKNVKVLLDVSAVKA